MFIYLLKFSEGIKYVFYFFVCFVFYIMLDSSKGKRCWMNDKL